MDTLNTKLMIKIITFTAVLAGLCYIGSYIVSLCGFIFKLSILAILVEIGILVFGVIFKKEIEETK